jgi:hypothetical protein
MFNVFNGSSYASQSKDICLPVGETPTEESRRKARETEWTRGVTGNTLVMNMRRKMAGGQ